MSEINYRSDIKVELIQTWGDDAMVARAARVSTGADTPDQEKIKGLIGYLLRNGHSSPVEHVGSTFRVEAPIFVARQWMRHRTQSFNERSLRFSEADPEFYIPGAGRPLVNNGSGAHPDLVPGTEKQQVVATQTHKRIAEDSMQYYGHLRDVGVAEEVARGVLPTSLYTYFYATADLWNWLGFIDKRTPSERNKPQIEIQWAAEQIQDLLTEHFPVTMNAWTATREETK